MTNLSILAQNTCAGLSDEAQELYLRGAGRNELKAFWMACEWDDAISPKLKSMCEASSKVLRDQMPNLPDASSEVYNFIRERHYRSYFPDGRSV